MTPDIKDSPVRIIRRTHRVDQADIQSALRERQGDVQAVCLSSNLYHSVKAVSDVLKADLMKIWMSTWHKI